MVRKYIKMAVRYAISRLQERSTRLGLIAVAASVGVAIEPAQLEHVVTVSVAVMGVVEALFPDKPTNVIALEK